MTSPLEFLMEELTSDNPQQCIQCISRLRVIGLALGAEKTRSDLIPFLKGEIEAGKFTDEVQVSVAEVLGSFSEFVGPSSEAHCLFPPLEALCAVEESTVRDQAVASINQVGAQLSASQLQTHLAPLVLRLARNKDWFTPRVSASGLVALAYSACEDAPAVGAELREEFKALAGDDSPMVRRAAAARLGAVADSYGTNLVEEELAPIYRGMVVDEGESVRVNALKQTALLCKNASLATRALLLKECFTSCTRDKSWRVRIAAAESLPAVAEACKDEGSPLSDELRGPLEAMYKALQSDHESEVRVAAALRGAEAAAALGTAFGEKHIFPTVSRLANDANSVSRVELSTVCIELAAPLGKAAALEHVLPCLALLADDELSNVRLAVIMQLGPFIDVVGLDGEAAAMLPLLERLGADKNWRVRHVILHLLPQLAATLGPAEFWSHFGEVCARRASDSCALVREDWVVLMAEICGLGGFGQAWAEETLLPIVTALSGEQSYLLRAVIPSFTAGFAQILTPGSLETKLVPAVLEMASDRVPNLRMIAARALAACTPLVDPGLARETIVPKLQEMLGDGDVDVKSEADAALESDKLKGFC